MVGHGRVNDGDVMLVVRSLEYHAHKPTVSNP